MKVLELLEAGPAKWGSWMRTPQTQTARSAGPSYGGAEDQSWDTRLQGAAKEAKLFKISGQSKSGTTGNGKPYNVVVSIAGPGGSRLKAQVDKFLRTESNIHHEFADIKVRPIDEETSIADIYINADERSLVRQAVERGYYGN